MAVVPVAAMQPGEFGEIVDIFGDERIVARLGERGVRKGCRLEALAVGDPLLLKVDETRLSLRTDGQIEMLVQLVGGNP